MTMLSIETWRSAAEDALSVLVVEQYLDPDASAFTRSYHERGLSAHHFPEGVWRDTYQTVVKLRIGARAINWQTLSTECSALMTEGFYTGLVTLYDTVRVADFPETVTALIETGTRALAISEFESGVKKLQDGADINQTVNVVVSGVSSLGVKKIENETAGASAHRLDRIFDSAPPPIIPTGFGFIDLNIGGIRSERMLILAGPYKSHKTHIGINCVISAYRAGKKPAIMSLENSIEVTEMQMISMLAIEWLLKQKKVVYTPDASVYWISPDGLMQAGSGYKNWASLKVQAIDFARAELKRIGEGIRIYDRSQEGGNLSDTLSIQSCVQRDTRLYGGDMYMVDHQGLVSAKGEVYEATRSVTNYFQKLSRIREPHMIHLMVLAQMSEAAIKAKSAYSAGIKGGGDTTANADYVVRTVPMILNKQEGTYYDDRIKAQIKQNRWGATTGQIIQMFHPQSGLHLTEELMAWHNQQAGNKNGGGGHWMDDAPSTDVPFYDEDEEVEDVEF